MTYLCILTQIHHLAIPSTVPLKDNSTLIIWVISHIWPPLMNRKRRTHWMQANGSKLYGTAPLQACFHLRRMIQQVVCLNQKKVLVASGRWRFLLSILTWILNGGGVEMMLWKCGVRQKRRRKTRSADSGAEFPATQTASKEGMDRKARCMRRSAR